MIGTPISYSEAPEFILCLQVSLPEILRGFTQCLLEKEGITNSMEQSPSWEANTRSVIQEISPSFLDLEDSLPCL
jgi:hypothetical protein